MKLISEARAYLKKHLHKKGAKCPCCNKYVHADRRPLNKTMVASLEWLVATFHKTGSWVDVPNRAPRKLLRTKQLSTCKHWGLLVRYPNDDPTVKHSGLWAPTKRGVAFVCGKISVPKYAVIYNDRRLRFEGDKISIEDARGIKFDYRDFWQDD